MARAPAPRRLGPTASAFWQERFESINAFERHIERNGTKIVKLFLHVSKSEQRRRLLARLTAPHKEWKFSATDLAERAYWDDYMQAFEDAISATSTPWAPWHVIPADHKPLMRALAALAIVDAISSLELQWPQVTAEERAANQRAREQLEAEDEAAHTALTPAAAARIAAFSACAKREQAVDDHVNVVVEDHDHRTATAPRSA